MKSTTLAAALFAAALSLGPATPAFAGPVAPGRHAQTQVPVTLDVSPACTISASSIGIAFSGYAGTADAHAYNPDLLQVTCTQGAPYSVILENGDNTTDDGYTQLLNAAANGAPGALLRYQMYQDSAETINWSGNNAHSLQEVGSGAIQHIPGWAKIASGQPYFVGSYLDTVIADVVF